VRTGVFGWVKSRFVSARVEPPTWRMGVKSSDETGRELPSTTLPSLLTIGLLEVAGVSGLRVRGMGLYETEMSRCTKTARRAAARFSIKVQHIVVKVTFLAHLPHVYKQHRA